MSVVRLRLELVLVQLLLRLASLLEIVGYVVTLVLSELVSVPKTSASSFSAASDVGYSSPLLSS